MDYTIFNYTRVWNINKQLVVAPTVEDAISLYKSYTQDNFTDITNIVAVGDDNIPQNYFAIIKQ